MQVISSPSKMKIAHIITRMVRGGADENTLLSCNAQAAAGHEVHLIFGAQAHNDMLCRADGRVVLHQVPSLVRAVHPLQDARAVLTIIGLLRKLTPDVVHTHTSKAGIIGRAAGFFARSRSIIHGVHILPFLNVGKAERIVYLAAERALAAVTDAFVNVSKGMRDACLQHQIGHPGNHFVVPSGMDIHAFLHAQPLDDATLAQVVPEAAQYRVPILLMVAALEARKRVIEFLDVFNAILAHRPDARFVVLGEGVDRPCIERAIERKGLAGKVLLAGFRTDVEQWIARADVCVLSSEREGLPRAIVQYVAGARPCVVTELPGVDVVVKHGVTGFLVPTERLDAMVEPIVRLLTDPALAQSMADQARKLDLLPWSVENMTGELERIYAGVLSKKRARP